MTKICCIVFSTLFLFTCAISAHAGDLDSFKGQKGTLKIAGGTAHIPVMKEAAKLIMQANPDLRITIAGGGSGVGIKQVGEGLIDIGNAGRKATDKEVSTYGLTMYKWAVDGVGVVVNPKNTVTKLTTAQLQDIFSGKISNWKELGGADRAINLYDRDAASGTRSVFWKKGLQKANVSTTANIVASNGAMKTAIAGDPYGIGFVSVGHIDASIAPVTLDGIAPSLENVKSGAFKVSRGLYSLTKGEAQGLAKLFIDFIFSPTGQDLVKAKGFVAVQ
ncbi:phosphate ABC transporter substrate-binding protein [Desulfobulbus rhabdoformis]|uniref:phosphate ABC transporter substrate-binding protein n=1 Tax=Desulfobulbus rhabdoformis TaxID=34032 RepID=UPI0019627FE2|nr:phosphate ABC transporter substrate-binding protein [Desulfobulbus rhabdoformis]MBM9612865.1 phosphate ABC transporter substrate-binding protein [Desulfobulbus rhabdoformis]